jgi:hypothetical protein
MMALNIKIILKRLILILVEKQTFHIQKQENTLFWHLGAYN